MALRLTRERTETIKQSGRFIRNNKPGVSLERRVEIKAGDAPSVGFGAPTLIRTRTKIQRSMLSDRAGSATRIRDKSAGGAEPTAVYRHHARATSRSGIPQTAATSSSSPGFITLPRASLFAADREAIDPDCGRGDGAAKFEIASNF